MKSLLLALLLAPASAFAAPLVYRIEGQVTRAEEGGEHGIAIGDHVVGYIAHDPDINHYYQSIIHYTVDSPPGPGEPGSYPNTFPPDDDALGSIYFLAAIELSVGGDFLLEQHAAIGVGPFSNNDPIVSTTTAARTPIQVWSLGKLVSYLPLLPENPIPLNPWAVLLFEDLAHAPPRWENERSGEPLLTVRDISPFTEAAGPITGMIGFSAEERPVHSTLESEVSFEVTSIVLVPTPQASLLLLTAIGCLLPRCPRT